MITKMSASSMNAKTWYRSMLAGNDAYSPGSYDLIETTILGSDTSSVTFSSIAQTYKHLQVRVTMRSTNGGTSSLFYIRLNGDTGTNYSRHWLRGDGATPAANAGSSEAQAWLGYMTANADTSNAFSPAILDIADYASTTKNKTMRLVSGSIGGFKQVGLWSGGWYNTAAVTSITLFPNSNNFMTGSRFSLYGIKG